MAQHSQYWSCSTFADWLRGTKKLSAGTAEEWDDWTTAAQMKHNFRYWLAEEGLSHLQDFVTWPVRKIYDLKYYINNRFVTRTHALTASPRDIPRGEWRDVGNRFLPCMFNELVDFVEVELAWSHIAWSNKEDCAKYAPPFWATGWFRWRTWRCPQAGLDSLEWQRELRHSVDSGWAEDDPNIGLPTPQAVKAQEVLDLYKWWTEVYHQRPDPHDASGWSEYCELKRQEHGETGLSFMKESANPETRALGDVALKKTHEIEQAYDAEDEAMMIRLIKVRHGLWT
jgi:hypothetical protein